MKGSPGVVNTENSPFFIVGSGRSGTTLLRMILAGHSRISIPPETWYIIPLVQELPIGSPLTGEQVTRACQIMVSHYRWPDLNIDANGFRQKALGLEHPTLRDIVDIVYDGYLAMEGKARWGDKTPPYIQIVPQLHRLYPRAKFIYLVRDGHDVAKSFQAKGWYGRWLYANTREWEKAARFYRQYRRSHPEIPVLEIKYEMLVTHTEETVRRICEFLNERFDTGMLDWKDQLADKIPEREANIHAKLSRMPRESDIYRWRREMSSRDVLVAEAFMHDELRRQGYQMRYSGRYWVPVFFGVRVFCYTVLPLASLCGRAYRYAVRRVSKWVTTPSTDG